MKDHISTLAILTTVAVIALLLAAMNTSLLEAALLPLAIASSAGLLALGYAVGRRGA